MLLLAAMHNFPIVWIATADHYCCVLILLSPADERMNEWLTD